MREEKKEMKVEKKKPSEPKVLAYRRACKKSANGTGLSHYIFIDNKKGRAGR
jgi:modified peptide precursor CbpA